MNENRCGDGCTTAFGTTKWFLKVVTYVMTQFCYKYWLWGLLYR